jgi:hypothetical protein
MIETRFGTKIEFIKHDEFVVEMRVSVQGTKGDKIVASPKFTIDQLQEELSILQMGKGK